MFKLKTAFKYIFSKSNGNKSTSIFILIGIALSLCSMILILSVMDALQSSQLDRYRIVSTFDLVIKSDFLNPDQIASIDGVNNSFEFADFDVLLTNPSSEESITGKIRALSKNVYESSNYIYTENFDGLLVSGINSSKLSLNKDDSLVITFLKKGKTNLVVPVRKSFSVSGIFLSDLSEFNSIFSIIPLDDLRSITDKSDIKIGIYADNYLKLNSIIKQIKSLDSNAEITDWKNNNGIIYAAMKLEKTVIFLFLILVCIIVCLNLKNSTSRLINSKIKEAGILRTMGMTKNDIIQIFLLYGLIIVICGEFAGVILSLIIINNFGLIMNCIDSIMHFFGSYNFLSAFSLDINLSAFNVLMFFTFVFVIAVIFNVYGIRKALNKDLMEVILNVSD